MVLTDSTALQSYGRELFRSNRDQWENFEQAAQAACEQIYNEFKEDGDSIFALVRIFRLSNSDTLPPEEDSTMAGGHWLTLMGTYGDEPEWCNRMKSQGHRVIPAGAFGTPMLKAVFEQTNLDVKSLEEGEDIEPTIIMDGSQLTKFFHVEDAKNSPYIVAQDEFVKPYNIKSVVGIGSAFVSNSLYVCIGFSKITLDKEMAENFASLSPFLSTLMSLYDSRGKLWSVISA